MSAAAVAGRANLTVHAMARRLAELPPASIESRAPAALRTQYTPALAEESR
ncbi:hypothetical protein [Amycolatopsis magusensis]|uniref:hypothetical protein n=1 Tax=Amycolatopsis magusensis TaxID=882444 RepID=UPI0024A8F9AB|nr:hypothetical protein [Amycolatopsis magusensis]MDI5978859.1 hypothetical protein [Amycolatopsis magusensis]